jgi:hypothetical protein
MLGTWLRYRRPLAWSLLRHVDATQVSSLESRIIIRRRSQISDIQARARRPIHAAEELASLRYLSLRQATACLSQIATINGGVTSLVHHRHL